MELKVFERLVFDMRRKEKARKEKKPVDWTYPISFPSYNFIFEKL